MRLSPCEAFGSKDSCECSPLVHMVAELTSSSRNFLWSAIWFTGRILSTPFCKYWLEILNWEQWFNTGIFIQVQLGADLLRWVNFSVYNWLLSWLLLEPISERFPISVQCERWQQHQMEALRFNLQVMDHLWLEVLEGWTWHFALE